MDLGESCARTYYTTLAVPGFKLEGDLFLNMFCASNKQLKTTFLNEVFLSLRRNGNRELLLQATTQMHLRKIRGETRSKNENKSLLWSKKINPNHAVPIRRGRKDKREAQANQQMMYFKIKHEKTADN